MKRVGSIGRAWQVVLLAAAFLALPPMLPAQQGVVSGTVVVAGSQRPLSGAQIIVAGETGRGAVSDASGRFAIAGLSGAEVVLNARLIGYRPATLTARVGATDVRFSMTERALELDQVVVTGTAGGEQKRAIGTSIASVNVWRTRLSP